ncbi:MAG: hypothetical protein QCH96_06875 [Candidatus Thermoplasmatota archaeon]|nr:hypothetical protein [Candidatus Thermoplasmatota archaeon]
MHLLYRYMQYNPSGSRGYLWITLGIDTTYAPWTQYKAISKEIEEMYGTLDTNTTLSLLQNVYLGKTNIMFRMILTKHTQTGRQWVACPKTGEIHICFSTQGNEAYENTIHTFNLYDLLEQSPP